MEDDITLLRQVVLLGAIAVIESEETGLIEMVIVETAFNDPFVEGVLICQVRIFLVTVIKGKRIFIFCSMVLENEVLTRLLHDCGQYQYQH